MRQKIALSRTIKNRYQKSAKKEKVVILDEFVATTAYHRSYARRILGCKSKHVDGRRTRRKKTIVRQRVYDASVFYALRLKGRSTTKPGSLLKASIQVRTFADWDDARPGFFEVDLVAFCGDLARDDFVNGLNLTDVATGWVGLEAVMGKASSRVNPAIDAVRRRLPFTMLGIDSDNGSEFINGLLKRYCEQYGITFTRSRPYKKNDNCYVEQKNHTVMRRFLGYARFDTDMQLNLARQILAHVEVYVNFFQPIMKLVEKKRIAVRLKSIMMLPRHHTGVFCHQAS